jgi:hypothetical protein
VGHCAFFVRRYGEQGSPVGPAQELSIIPCGAAYVKVMQVPTFPDSPATVGSIIRKGLQAWHHWTRHSLRRSRHTRHSWWTYAIAKQAAAVRGNEDSAPDRTTMV